MVKLKKLSKQGGYRALKPLKTSQGRLLKTLWDSLGGVHEAAKKIGIPKQLLVNWRGQEKVPLTRVGPTSRKLKISVWLLNYEELFTLQGEGPDWKLKVEEMFKGEELSYILKGSFPKKLLD